MNNILVSVLKIGATAAVGTGVSAVMSKLVVIDEEKDGKITTILTQVGIALIGLAVTSVIVKELFPDRESKE